jgi:hypothetical protein
MICGGANINQKGKNAQFEEHTPSKHPKHLNNPKLKQKLATTKVDSNNRGDLQKISPTTTESPPRPHINTTTISPHITTETPSPPLHHHRASPPPLQHHHHHHTTSRPARTRAKQQS